MTQATIVDAAGTAKWRVRAHFLGLNATSAADAIEYAPPGPFERAAFDEMRAAGTIRDAAPGHYWLDLGHVPPPVPRRRNWRRVLPLLIALVLAFSTWWWMF